MDVEITYHIKDARKEKKMSLQEVSDISGVSTSQINDIENGKKDPTVRTLCLLSLALGVPPSKLFSARIKR